MSTAVLISGQLRTFARCWPTQRWHVLRHFSKTLSGVEGADPHFFFCVQDEMKGFEPFELGLLREEYGPERVHVRLLTDPDLSAHLTPELSAAYHLAPYTNAAPAHQLLLQHWYQAECWKFFQSQSSPQSSQISDTENTEPNKDGSSPTSSSASRPTSVRSVAKKNFDTIIRLRADLWFHSLELDPFLKGHRGFDEVRNISTVVKGPRAHQCFTPWWGRFGGINDRFAIMGPEAAKHYFNVFEAIPELLAAGCPFHPESLVKANLERGNVDLHETLRTEFTTFRADGKHRPPEIMPCDIAHAALRNAA